MTLKNGSKVLIFKSTNHESVPEKKKPIRCELYHLFVFKSLSSTQTEVTHVGYFDPKMKIPGFAKKRVIDAQIDDFLKKKEHIELNKDAATSRY